jgi:hypothetical protein
VSTVLWRGSASTPITKRNSRDAINVEVLLRSIARLSGEEPVLKTSAVSWRASDNSRRTGAGVYAEAG